MKTIKIKSKLNLNKQFVSELNNEELGTVKAGYRVMISVSSLPCAADELSYPFECP